MQFIPRTVVLTVALSTTASAQFGNTWVEFVPAQARLPIGATAVSSPTDEVDFDWGDLDRDGWVDLVAVRKQPNSTPGKRANLLLMNEFGTLVDRSALYTSSDVAGDQGFLTPTNDRDVSVVDVDNDGWLDVVTAPTYSDADPKHVGHPRVYYNLGRDGAGNWRGLRHEDARIPQLLTSTGIAGQPSFCGVDAGDVDGDGFADLYFADYDGGSQWDYEDRLLVNDGRGNFVDETDARMAPSMVSGFFHTSSVVTDLNRNGTADLVTADAGTTSSRYAPGTPGQFTVFDTPYFGSAYHVSSGDLNRDGRPDLLISDDGSDRYLFNLSTDAFGRAVFGPSRVFDFLAGGDDSVAGTNLVADLNRDGWNDALIADVDVDFSGCSRRMHVYHNLGGTPGTEITLREERQQASGGWVGAVGLADADLVGTYDMAVFDIDNDGWNDLVVGRCSGTYVWRNAGLGTGSDGPATSGRIGGFVTVRR